jgi:cyclophilin family peptidyl-prolyl cis-trans isomerase
MRLNFKTIMKKTALICYLCLLGITAFAQKETKIAIATDYGKIVMLLYDNTPLHRDNMIKLAKSHFYDSTLFHRVIPNFVIQGGDPQSKQAQPGTMLGNGEIGYRIPAEINDADIHKRGAVGMARDGNPKKESSGCQFYIVTGKKATVGELDNIDAKRTLKYTPEQRQAYLNEGGTPHLDGGYTVFGEVIEGMDVVDKISAQACDPNSRPKADIRMINVRLVKKKKRFLGIF